MSDDFKSGNPIAQRAETEAKARRILGVSSDASETDIKKAYWLLAMEHHPDKNPGDHEARARFQNILNAYRVLVKDADPDAPLSAEGAPEMEGEPRIGEFASNDWGYFCWWRDAFMSPHEKDEE